MKVKQYFNEHRTLLAIYAAHWGLDAWYDLLAHAVDVNSDIQYCARKMFYEIPETRYARTSGYYILEKMTNES